jgi:hypothetical protein
MSASPGEDTPDMDAMANYSPTLRGDTTEDILFTYMTNWQSSDHIPPAHLAKLISDAINKHTKHGNNTQNINASVTFHYTEPLAYSMSLRAHVDAYWLMVDLIEDSLETYDSGHTVDIDRIDWHHMGQIPLGSGGAVVKTQLGPAKGSRQNYSFCWINWSIPSLCVW